MSWEVVVLASSDGMAIAPSCIPVFSAVMAPKHAINVEAVLVGEKLEEGVKKVVCAFANI